MTNTAALMERNRTIAESHDGTVLPPLPKYRAVILACADGRADPTHIMGLEPGDAVVIRNTGARVTKQVLEEVAALAFVVSRLDGETPGPFEFIIMQHTQCGAQMMANPDFQAAIKGAIGVDVSESAITDQEADLKADVERVRAFAAIPDYVTVSAYLHNLGTGLAQEVCAPQPLR